MIRSFADEQTRRIWLGERASRLPTDIQVVAMRKLRLLNAAARLDDLRVPPGNRLEALRGDRNGQHSIRINDQWRICFVWTEGGADDVEIVDYHR
ncbi:MAG: type II toxin-antitoxin system RelE/ParE family toxin [Methylobacteriaceae bacterium]|nr:type II toxin-antitoxin system RelE/ParE family toxin [Methylobacteriaceae bacterium]